VYTDGSDNYISGRKGFHGSNCIEENKTAEVDTEIKNNKFGNNLFPYFFHPTADLIKMFFFYIIEIEIR